MPAAEVNGARLAYEEAGDGKAVVFLHEGIADSRMWDPQFEALARRYRVVRVDLRGFGSSTLPGGPYSHTDDLRVLLDGLGIDHAAIVCASMSARAGIELAVLDPARVDALVIAPPGGVTEEQSETIRRLDEAEEEAIERGDNDGAVELNLDLWVGGPRRPLDAVDPDVVERVREMLRRAFEIQTPVYESESPPTLQRLLDGPLQGHLADIACPTLVLVGDEDVEDIVTAAELIAALVPGARKRVLLGAAHVLSLERPAEVTAAVDEFLGAIL
jgi:pimeloyl-ACP methyl ester carboxylesterase